MSDLLPGLLSQPASSHLLDLVLQAPDAACRLSSSRALTAYVTSQGAEPTSPFMASVQVLMLSGGGFCHSAQVPLCTRQDHGQNIACLEAVEHVHAEEHLQSQT